MASRFLVSYRIEDLLLPEAGYSVFKKITAVREGGTSEIEMLIWMEITASSY